MKITNTEEKALIALGMQASHMLSHREYAALASHFGYALSHGRAPAEAIKFDHEKAMLSPYKIGNQQLVSVKYFKPNSAGVYAAIDCLVSVSSSSGVLLSLVVTGRDADKHLTIEDISGITS